MKQTYKPGSKESSSPLAISLWALCGISLLVSGCSVPLVHAPNHERDLRDLLTAPPLLATDMVAIHRLPESCDLARVVREIETTVTAVSQWLGTPPNRPVLNVLIFARNDPLAQAWRADTHRNHGCTGRLYYGDQDPILLVIGDPCDARFWDVLRHEVTHGEVQAMVGHDLVPFWFDEGMATLFEAGVDQTFTPRFNQERWTLCKHLLRSAKSLHTKRLIRRSKVTYANGDMYARAWAIMAYLYSSGFNPDDYVRAIRNNTDSLTSFEACFLGPGQSFTSFDRDLSAWVVHASNTP